MIAVLSDIHGNIQALDAVLVDMPQEVTDILVLGDIVGGLAGSCKVMDRLMNLTTPLTAILGNWEENLFDGKNGLHPEYWQGTQFATLAWTIDTLQPQHWAFLEGLNRTLTFDKLDGGAFLFHAKPDDSFNGIHSQVQAEEAVKAYTKKWLICGHTHQARLFRVGDQRVVTVGSVGHSVDKIGGVACYTLIDGDKVVFRYVSYDVGAAIADIKASELPHIAPGFAKANALTIGSGRNYTHELVHFARAYDGTWEEGEQAWINSQE